MMAVAFSLGTPWIGAWRAASATAWLEGAAVVRSAAANCSASGFSSGLAANASGGGFALTSGGGSKAGVRGWGLGCTCDSTCSGPGGI